MHMGFKHALPALQLKYHWHNTVWQSTDKKYIMKCFTLCNKWDATLVQSFTLCNKYLYLYQGIADHARLVAGRLRL